MTPASAVLACTRRASPKERPRSLSLQELRKAITPHISGEAPPLVDISDICRALGYRVSGGRVTGIVMAKRVKP